MKNAELTPTAQRIGKIINRIDEGDIKIPAFQRGYVWKQEQIIDLLESIVAQYPIGSVLLWKTSERLKSTRNIAGYKISERDESYPVNYTLDGQQRLASIYGVFSQELEQEQYASGYNPGKDIFEIYYDFSEEKFLDKDSVVNQRNTIHLRKLLDVRAFFPALSDLDEKYHKSAQNLQSQFLNYEIPVVTIENRSRADVGIIFERINNTGTRLTTLDLMTAWTWTDDFHLLESCHRLSKELKEKGFGRIKDKTILQIISAVIQDTTVSKAIINLEGEQVRNDWPKITDGIKKAIDFLSTDMNCRHIDFLPFTQQLIPLVKFFDLVERPTSEQLKIMRQYFWKTSFSNRYSTGQTNAKMDADIENIKSLREGNLKIFDDYQYTVTPLALRSTTFSKSNPITRAFLLLMAQMAPLDLINGQKIDIGKSLAQYNRKEYHHVFPQAFLKSRGVSNEKISCVLNFCFLSSGSNKTVSKTSPSDYFFHLIPEKRFGEILSSNLLPLKKQVYKEDDYDGFVEKRSGEVLSKLDKLT
uniref:GmrSD restriction endonucleases N-terminal domain-containing protein n=1 Tax=Candidatus Kentrum sp. TUN TaxID=2126343 RepID=A0A450ZSH2_9GAMM|nr:MAG: hypothetical protein BECKTUN1418F_GA0071002_109413 [Candidatus Kentron sp. TUN]VFK65657.1 MAG: hypothetical protein BECKTUN1418E_GA0071001_11115 [Candidatus Kentron sp. TUN]